jgi:hypothetical protein
MSSDETGTTDTTGAAGQATVAAVLDETVAGTQRDTATVAAAGACAINGGVHVLAALQLWSTVWLFGVYNAIPYAMVALAIACVVLGSKVYGQRLLAVRVAIAVQGLDALAMGIWLLLTLGSGIFSVLMMVLPAASLSGALLCAFAYPSCAKTERARRRAAAAGLDIDL